MAVERLVGKTGGSCFNRARRHALGGLWNTVVRLIYERGRFTPADTAAVALALAAYSGYFLVGSIGQPVINALYALQKTALVATVGVVGFAAYVVLAYGLAGRIGFDALDVRPLLAEQTAA
jgi:peptidoglycan biosynthesis protein MviN/MurJ (putative lipid II flippase)